VPDRRAAVLGHPVAHSLSPALHRAAYLELGLDWAYDAIDCTEADLPTFLDGLDGGWAGLSLTMPLKRAVLPLLDERDPIVDVVDAANTVLFDGGLRRGANTDVDGIVAALAEGGVTEAATGTVLGAGGTAAAALAAFARIGAGRVTVAARSARRAEVLAPVAAALGVVVDLVDWPGPAVTWTDRVVVSTVPAGATDELAGRLPGLPGLLLDVVYSPWPTALADAAAAAGGTVVGGLPMLVHQAAAQVTLMTGRQAPLAAMRAAGEAALAARFR
jgi:shikimate dehydrogenase